MAQTRFAEIESVFHAIIEAPEETRAALIEARCQSDPELAAEVRSLLLACEAQEHLTASQQLQPEASQDDRPSRKRIGPYELDRLLGRGGMGAVYLAHRADGQFEQQVAIKLIDLPLATDLFRERFRQERQILAELQHPYIARLLDGGVTPQGDLYLVMEYVDGVPIHRFCEERRLSTTQRIALFIRVCEAVQFAHHNFVVHRDLKPDNILVAADGTPRLLDFGTAKLLSPSPLGPDSKLTREGYQSFTPQYASPEQVLGNRITTASDTYSLGVLLYLLLAGAVPYELKELTTAEMLRVICEEPPRKPPREAGSDRRLDADLEAILLKALRKEPQERYLSAEQLSADLRAYLEGLPVAARRGTLRYRAGKFIRRRRFSVAAAALLAASLIAGVVGVLWQARVANAERRKAEARSADLRQLSNSLLSELDEAIKELPGSTGVQKLLVTRVLEHLDRMARDARGDRQIQLDLVDAYTRLGNIQGNAYDQNLGDPAGALVSLSKALAIAQPLAASNSLDREAIRALALVQQSRSEILWQTDRTPEAIPVMREAMKSFDALILDPHAPAARVCDVASAYGTLGDELGQSGTASLADSAGAISAYRQSVALDNRVLSIDPNSVRAKRGLAINGLKIGSVEMETDAAEALKEFQFALQRAETMPRSDQDSLSGLRIRHMLLRKEANALERLGEFVQAVPLFEQSLVLITRIAAQDQKDTRALFDLITVLDDEAKCYEDAADPVLVSNSGDRRASLVLAEKKLAQAAAALESLLKQDPANDVWRAFHASVQVRISVIQSSLHTAGAWEESARKALVVLRDVAAKPQASPMVLDQAANAFLTVQPATLRDPRLAISCAEREVALSHAKEPSKLLTLAEAYRASGQIEKSRAAAKGGLALLPPPQPGSVEPNIRKLLEKASE
ncbi:MAG: serine/threonine-protein kinase [Terriglobia bacterium]|jgi:tetratricopeptide (TPR) repeat protein